MRCRLRLAVAIAALALAASLTPAARAQGYGEPYYGPYQGLHRSLTGGRQYFTTVPTFTNIRLQTTATIPDRGSVVLGGYSRYSEGRNEFGAPVLGKTPYLGRGFRTVGYGRDVTSTRVIASVRVIDLYEEELRQTGVDSRR
jgi:type II secretory pathway component GspD/PulD (secretin)